LSAERRQIHGRAVSLRLEVEECGFDAVEKRSVVDDDAGSEGV